MIALLILATPLCIADITYHRIPNIYLVTGLYAIAAERIFFGVASIEIVAAAVVVMLALHVVIKIGMGDVKLIVLITLGCNCEVLADFLRLLAAISLFASAAGIMQILRKGDRKGSIALAPSIFLGTSLYLCSRSSSFLQEYADALVNSW